MKTHNARLGRIMCVQVWSRTTSVLSSHNIMLYSVIYIDRRRCNHQIVIYSLRSLILLMELYCSIRYILVNALEMIEGMFPFFSWTSTAISSPRMAAGTFPLLLFLYQFGSHSFVFLIVMIACRGNVFISVQYILNGRCLFWLSTLL
jgi:hypothetical protein